MYFKITNKDENHHNFQYVDGLNILQDEFNNDPNQSCCAGGFYFTDVANIFKFLDYGIYLRIVTLPINNPDFLMINDKSNDKWRANMIILGKRYDLSDVNTFKYLVDKGANIHVDNDLAFCWSAKNGYLDTLKYLTELGVNDCTAMNDALCLSAQYGHLDIVKYLVDNGSDIHTDDDLALCLSAEYGQLSVVKYLVESGTYSCRARIVLHYSQLRLNMQLCCIFNLAQ